MRRARQASVVANLITVTISLQLREAVLDLPESR
jgi:hypothetical protein